MKLLITLTCLILTGCNLNEYQHDTDPNGVETIFFRRWSILSDTSADGIKLTTPDGTVLEVTKIVQEADSLKVWTPYGMVQTSK